MSVLFITSAHSGYIHRHQQSWASAVFFLFFCLSFHRSSRAVSPWMNTTGGWQVWNVKWQSLCGGHRHVSRLSAVLPLLPLPLLHEDGWAYATLIGRARGSQRERRAFHSSSLLLRFTSPWTPQCAARPSARTWNRALVWTLAPWMPLFIRLYLGSSGT